MVHSTPPGGDSEITGASTTRAAAATLRLLQASARGDRTALVKPPRERHQHQPILAPQVDERSFRQGWQVVTRLDALRASGAIDAAAYVAGVRYRTAAERVERSQRLHQAWDIQPGGGDGAAAVLGALDALGWLRRANGRLGALEGPLRACLLEDLTWRTLAKRLGCEHRTAQKRVVEALKLLADASD